MNSRPSIIPGHCGDVVWVRVEGAGSKENSADVAEYLTPQIGGSKQRLVVDLESCTSLDSTFMGMLIGMAKQISHEKQGCLHIINAHGRNAQLLRGLGVQYFCEMSEDDGPFTAHATGDGCACPGEGTPLVTRDEIIYGEALTHRTLTKQELTEHCLQAHSRLCEAGQGNQEKFQHVVELMEQKLVQLRQ